MPNLVQIGIRGWAGRTPSLSPLSVLPFVGFQSINRCVSFRLKTIKQTAGYRQKTINKHKRTAQRDKNTHKTRQSQTEKTARNLCNVVKLQK